VNRWRTGRKLGRTLYRDDVCVGMVDDTMIAAEIVVAMNARAAAASPSTLAPVPRGHCNRCDRCGWPFGDGCRVGNCARRPVPLPMSFCSGCFARYDDTLEEGSPMASTPIEESGQKPEATYETREGTPPKPGETAGETAPVVPLFRCKACGKEGRPTELEYEGKILGKFYACDECVAKVEGHLANVRPVFDAMIAAGVDRSIANETMTFLLDGLPDPWGRCVR